VSGSVLTAEETGKALAVAATGDGWVAARPPGQVSGSAREWWPGPLAVLRAAGDASTVTWAGDPDGCDLQVTRPGEPAIRFAARNPGRALSPPGTAAKGEPS
jgi:hypothetical protein